MSEVPSLITGMLLSISSTTSPASSVENLDRIPSPMETEHTPPPPDLPQSDSVRPPPSPSLVKPVPKVMPKPKRAETHTDVHTYDIAIGDVPEVPIATTLEATVIGEAVVSKAEVENTAEPLTPSTGQQESYLLKSSKAEERR